MFKYVCRAIRFLAPSTLTGPVPIGYGESVPVKSLAEKFGQGDFTCERVYTW